ncbi:MAG TPA: DEAD/DEAH box helicase, partial [Myxococcota bacterium]|nr:DEAD/DEAH box helicase [Myxococcota bacterium]
MPRQPLDVLAQQIVASVAEEPVSVEALRTCLSRAASYAGLSRSLLDPVLDMLSGRYPSTDFAELRPRLLWDREADRLEIREGAGRIALLSGGTIPDRGQYTVHLGAEGPRVGELDEEMVHETKPGDVVTLGASSWRVLEITRDRVIVAPAPGEPGRLPFWRGEGPGRPIELGRALGAFTRELLGRSDARAWLVETKGLDAHAAENLVDYVSLQRAWTGSCPTDRRITIERFRDELGDWRVCLLSPFGARVHAPWALAIEARLAERSLPGAQILWTDDGIMLRFADADRLPPSELFVLDPDEIEELVVTQLESSALYATEFRENAARALLLPRRRPGARTPLWTQRLRAQTLQAVAAAFPDFPIVLETYRSCLQDVFDLPALTELMEAIRERSVTIDDVETRSASPFARSLVFAYTAAYLYQGDMPAAERRSQALALDRHMLRELLGAEALRDLLDADVIDRVEARLQGLDPELRARHADALHDLLRRVGDLDPQELAERFEGDPRSLRRMLG